MINQEDAQQSWVLIGHATNLLYEDDDYPAMVLLNEILGGSFNSRIFRTVRTEMGLSYSPSGTLQAGFNSPGLLYLLAPTASENTVLAADALVNELRKIRDEKVTKEELQFAKNIYFNSFVFNYDSKRKILSNVKLYDFFGYDRNFPNQLKAKIEKVTINDIQRVAQKYLHPDQLTYLFVGNEAEFTESVSKFGEVTHVDISIKESLEETVLDMEKGNNIFKSMMDDIKGKKLINSVVNTSINTFYTPQGEMSMDKLTSVAFPNQISDEVSSPMGKITLKINGDKGIQAMEGRGSMPLPAEAISSTLSELMNSYFGWLYHDNNLSVGFIRDDSANGTAYSVIQIETSGKIKEVWVDKTTNLPGFIIEKVDTGTETLKIKTSFSDYARYEGVYCPKTISSKLIDGTPVSSITFTSIKFNVKIDDSIFTF
ncbi:MAG: hypothetical protein B6226_04785 [Candidatus Cloacimonetes bacterium 4572_65]|nr:MAG: hypothetical protein B6226_04785 [Candidatus Cloacimonetes bacterium 4572_65]